MKRLSVSSWVWILLSLLGASAVILLFSRDTGSTLPSASSARPSGVQAFVKLLNLAGYEVIVDSSERPRLEKTDLAVGFFIQQDKAFFMENKEPTSAKKPALRILEKHMNEGGRLLALTIHETFDDKSKEAKQNASKVSHAFQQDKNYTISMSKDILNLTANPLQTDQFVPTWVLETKQVFARTYPFEKGGMLEVGDGIGATNRFLGLEDNAAFYLDMVRRMASKNGRIVFVEASFSEGPTSLLQAIGPWAIAARWQAFLLFLIVVFSLGKRFGLSERDQPVQRGARELVDALADTMRRGKQAKTALGMVVENAELRLRRALNLAPRMSPNDFERVLPPDAAQLYRRARVELEASEAPTEAYAAKLSSELQELVHNLETSSPTKRL